MNIGLCNGVCGLRFRCKNIHKKECHPMPKEGYDFVECNFFKEKR